jgi:hypothetical protein
MPGTNSSSIKKKKQNKKRKTESPLSSDDSHGGQKGQTVISTSMSYPSGQFASNINNSAIDSFIYSQDYVSAVMNPNMNPQVNTPTHMNFGQPSTIPYGMSTPQTPGYYSINQGSPAWAIGIIDDVKTIKSALPKVKKIEQAVNVITVKLSEFENKLSGLETRMVSTEHSCSFISDEFERQKDELKNSKSEIRRLEKSCDELKGIVKNFKKKQST